MSRERLLQLAERRARLIERAHAEREALAALVAGSDAPLRAAAGIFGLARHALAEARDRPLLVAGAVALLVAMRPRRALGWLLKGWPAWRLLRGALRWWRRVNEAGAPAAR